MKKKNRKGFTIVELLGVFLILAVVIGIVSVAYIGVNKQIRKTYYAGVEQSLLQAGGEYFSYNKGTIPKVFGNQTEVKLDILLKDEHISNVVDRNGKSCDEENSYVVAYKNSLDKVNYYVCLKCEDYEYENNMDMCLGEMDYTLGITPTIRDTKEKYIDDSYVRGYVTMTYKTYNDMKEIKVEDEDKNIVKTCTLTGKNTKSCQIILDSSGKYTSYGIAENGSRTVEDEIEIKIDNDMPQFSIIDANNENIGNTIISIENQDNVNIENRVINISDDLSGIKIIKYSFELKNSNELFNEVNNNFQEFQISKSLGLGEYKLVVEVEDNAGNKNRQTVNYNVLKKVLIPTTDLNCQDITYTGENQTLTKEVEGITYSNNNQINAGTYTIKANLKNDYMWDDGSVDEKQFTCTIKRKNVAEIGSCKTGITYNGSNQTLASGGSNVTYTNNEGKDAGSYTVTVKSNSNYAFSDGTIEKTLNCSIGKRSLTVTAKDQTITLGNSIQTSTDYITTTNLVSGHSVTGITLTQSTTNITTSGKITPSGATIKANGTNVTSNYNITYTAGTLVIRSGSINDLTVSLKTTSYTYDGNPKTPDVTVKDGGTELTKNTDYTVSYKNNVNVGTGTVTVEGKGKYSGKKELTFTINKANGYVLLDNEESYIIKGGSNTIFFNVIDTHGGQLNVESTNTAITIRTKEEEGITVVKITNIPTNVINTIEIKVTSAATTNYNAATVKHTINIGHFSISSNATSNVPFVIPAGIGKKPDYRINEPSWKSTKTCKDKQSKDCNNGATVQQAIVEFSFDQTVAFTINHWLSEKSDCSTQIANTNTTKAISKSMKSYTVDITKEGILYFCWQTSDKIEKIGPLYVDGTPPALPTVERFASDTASFIVNSPQDSLSGTDALYIAQRSNKGCVDCSAEIGKYYFVFNKKNTIGCFGDAGDMRFINYSAFDKAGNTSSWQHMGKVDDSVPNRC